MNEMLVRVLYVGGILIISAAGAAGAGLAFSRNSRFSTRAALIGAILILAIASAAMLPLFTFQATPATTVPAVETPVPVEVTPEPAQPAQDNDDTSALLRVLFIVLGLAVSAGFGAIVSGFLTLVRKDRFSFRTFILVGGMTFIVGTIALLALRNYAIARQQEQIAVARGQVSQPVGSAQTQAAPAQVQPTLIPTPLRTPTPIPPTPVPDVAITGLKLKGPDEVELKKIAVFTATVTTGTNLSYQWFWDGNDLYLNTASIRLDTQNEKPGLHTVTVKVSNSTGYKQEIVEFELYDAATWQVWVDDAKKAVPDATISVATLRKIAKSFPTNLAYVYVSHREDGGLLPHPAVGRVLDQAAKANLNSPEGGAAYASTGNLVIDSKLGLSEFPWEKNTVQLVFVFGLPDDETEKDNNTTLNLFNYPVGHIYVTQLAPEQGQKLGKAVLNAPWLAQQLWWGLRGSSNCGVGCQIVALSAWDLEQHAAVTWIITTDKNYNLKWVLRDSWTPGK